MVAPKRTILTDGALIILRSALSNIAIARCSVGILLRLSAPLVFMVVLIDCRCAIEHHRSAVVRGDVRA